MNKTYDMTWDEAMDALEKGHKIKRQRWMSRYLSLGIDVTDPAFPICVLERWWKSNKGGFWEAPLDAEKKERYEAFADWQICDNMLGMR